MSLALTELALKSSVIDPEVHGKLIREVESVARRANIPVSMVWTSMTKFCTPPEIDYVRQLPKNRSRGIMGLVYLGEVPPENHDILERMSAVTAACIRNKINAQVMMTNDVIRETQAGTLPNPTVLLIPNFYMSTAGEIPKWRSGVLLDMLYSRQQENLQTFMYVQDMNKLGSDYGDSFVQHLRRFDHIPA